MPAMPSRARPRVPYWIRFSATVVSLVAFTSVFVLIVLPQRFVLNAGLVESGVTFPTGPQPFLAPRTPRAVTPRAPTPVAAPTIQPGPAEAFWNAVLPLERTGQLERTIPRFRAYLAAHPPSCSRSWSGMTTRSGCTRDSALRQMILG